MDQVAKPAAACPRDYTMSMLKNPNKALLIFLLALLLLVPVFSLSQSLGEIARQYRKEREAREKQGEIPIRVFTNDDVARTASPTSTDERAQPEPTTQKGKRVNPPSGNTVVTTSSESSAQPAATQDITKSKEYWQARFKSARATLLHAKEEQTLVEDELRLLQIQQARELDPDRSRKLNTRIDTKSIEVESRRAATEKAREALNNLEREFKESGAPQDWIDSGKDQN